MGVFDLLQIPYSALLPELEAAIACATKAGMGIVIRGGVARGGPGEGRGSTEVRDLWQKVTMEEFSQGMSAT